MAISPDGSRIVYVGSLENQPSLYVRALDQLEATRLRGLGNRVSNPFISPDGNWVGFFDDPSALQKVALSPPAGRRYLPLSSGV